MSDASTGAARKVIGRILSLGVPLPGPSVDNYTFISAPSFFDYDAIVVDPRALSLLIEGVIEGSIDAVTFAGLPVVNDAATPSNVALADVLLRRRDETKALLAQGGAVICFAHPATMHAGVAGISTLDDYYWLPSPPALVAGEGSQAQVVDFQHPLASFVHGQLANIDVSSVLARGDAARRMRVRAQQGRRRDWR